MRNSANYSLLLPDETDSYSVGDMNANTEIIDAQMKSNQTKADAVTQEHNTHVANKSNPHGVTKEQLGLGNVPNVSTNNQTPTYTVPSTLTALVSGEVLSTAFGKLAKAVSDLISHLGNKNNPHTVTKAQIGLGNVPDVSTNDQTPTYSDTTTLATLSSGEKLNVAFQKIKLAISRLITHLADTVSHITSAERSLWNSKADGALLHSRIPQYFNVKTQAELDAVMNEHSANLPINTTYNLTLSVAVAGLSITGGTYYVEGMKTSADYEWQRMTKYPDAVELSSFVIMGRSKFAGKWTPWENVTMRGEMKNYLYVNANAVSASKLVSPRTISLTGDVTGSVSFDGSTNVSMTTAIADDSHNHVISNVDGLQAALDAKQNAATAITTTNIANQSVKYATNAGGVAWTNVTDKPASYPPSTHNHDDRYFTETEVNNLLEQKVHIGLFANNRLSLQWIDTTSELKVFIDGVEIGAVMISKG